MCRRLLGLLAVMMLVSVGFLGDSLIVHARDQEEYSAEAEAHDLHDDAFVAPDVAGFHGMTRQSSDLVVPGYYQTSEYMIGTVAVGIVLVESDGSVDPSTEDWSAGEKLTVFNEIMAALDWWAALEPRARLSFVYDDHFTEPLPTGFEPISRPHTDQQYWIADAMAALGYRNSSYFASVRDYNNDLRQTYHTDWAFTIFVVDSSADPDNRFSDGYFSYAYLGGPFMVMTYGNGNYGPHNMRAVAAHEIGHIFYALDQYHQARQPCARRSGYLDVENQNSEYGDCASNEMSIMRLPMAYASKALDPYAAGQIGWRDSDGDGILDPLDTELSLSITPLSVDGETAMVSGTVSIIPYPSPSHQSVTINRLVAVQYRFNAGEWQPVMANDGAFDETGEDYHFTARLSPGIYRLEIMAVDSAGNVSYTSERVTVLDPNGEELDTRLERAEAAPAPGPVVVDGVAYHLKGQPIAQVEYRIDGGPWQYAAAEDGAFDSDYEPLKITLDQLEPGVHLVEARAIDAAGNVETTWASQEVVVTRHYSLYLPLVANGAAGRER